MDQMSFFKQTNQPAGESNRRTGWNPPIVCQGTLDQYGKGGEFTGLP